MKQALIATLLLGCYEPSKSPSVIIVDRFALNNTCVIGEVLGEVTDEEKTLAVQGCNYRVDISYYNALTLVDQRRSDYVREMMFGHLTPMCSSLAISNAMPGYGGKYFAEVSCIPKENQ
jgi:hypothetical protein